MFVRAIVRRANPLVLIGAEANRRQEPLALFRVMFKVEENIPAMMRVTMQTELRKVVRGDVEGTENGWLVRAEPRGTGRSWITG